MNGYDLEPMEINKEFVFKASKHVDALGSCHLCGQPVPADNIDGTPSRQGIEYKRVLGDVNILWHLEHPLYPNCFRAESIDRESAWFDDPNRYIDELDIALSEAGRG